MRYVCIYVALAHPELQSKPGSGPNTAKDRRIRRKDGAGELGTCWNAVRLEAASKARLRQRQIMASN